MGDNATLHFATDGSSPAPSTSSENDTRESERERANAGSRRGSRIGLSEPPLRRPFPRRALKLRLRILRFPKNENHAIAQRTNERTFGAALVRVVRAAANAPQSVRNSAHRSRMETSRCLKRDVRARSHRRAPPRGGRNLPAMRLPRNAPKSATAPLANAAG